GAVGVGGCPISEVGVCEATAVAVDAMGVVGVEVFDGVGGVGEPASATETQIKHPKQIHKKPNNRKPKTEIQTTFLFLISSSFCLFGKIFLPIRQNDFFLADA
ncbi:MAG: hypothetical protein ABIG86_03220, partial [Patescibacteria group bacterium]